MLLLNIYRHRPFLVHVINYWKFLTRHLSYWFNRFTKLLINNYNPIFPVSFSFDLATIPQRPNQMLLARPGHLIKKIPRPSIYTLHYQKVQYQESYISSLFSFFCLSGLIIEGKTSFILTYHFAWFHPYSHCLKFFELF